MPAGLAGDRTGKCFSFIGAKDKCFIHFGCVNTVKKPLSQAGKGMNFAARGARIRLMSTNQEKRKRGTNRITPKKCLRHSGYCGILNIKKDICANRCPTGATDKRLARLVRC